MEVALIIGLFVSTALSLNSLVGQKYKLAGTFNIINLCLIVAVAYQFEQVQNIIWALVLCVVLVVGFFIAKTYFKKKKSTSNVIDVDLIEDEDK